MSGLRHLSPIHRRRLLFNKKCPSCKKRFNDTVDFTQDDDGLLYYYCDSCCIRISFYKNKLNGVFRINEKSGKHPYYALVKNEKIIVYKSLSDFAIELDKNNFTFEKYFQLEEKFMNNEFLE